MTMQALTISHASFGHSCFDDETEILTVNGWKTREAILDDEIVATLNRETRRIEYHQIEQKFEYDYDGELCHFESSAMDHLVTPNHKMVYESAAGYLREIEAQAWTQTGTSAIVSGTRENDDDNINYTDDELRLLVWCMADGSCEYVHKGGMIAYWRFHLKKQRKIDRLSLLLDKLNIVFTRSPLSSSGTTKIALHLDTRFTKLLPPNFRVSTRQFDILVTEWLHTDGCFQQKDVECANGSGTIFTNSKHQVDKLQELAAICGAKTCASMCENGTYRLHIRLDVQTVQQCSSPLKGMVPYKGKVWCVSVPNHTLISRHNGHVLITGNSFFKNNHLFREWTDASSIIDYLIFARNYIHDCEVREGAAEVESFLDACHALMNYGVNRYKRPSKLSIAKEKARQEQRDAYRQSQVNEVFDTVMHDPRAKVDEAPKKRIPAQPEENILYFCEKFSPDLPVWKREIIRIVRKMSQYFYPQGQTKVTNEGCLVEGSLIETSDGMIPIEELVRQQRVTAVWDGDSWRKVYDWFENEPKRRIKIITHHGYEIHGGADHEILVDGVWKQLDQLQVGDELPIAYQHAVFAQDYADLPPVQWALRPTEREIAAVTNMRPSYYRSVLNGRHACNPERMQDFLLYQQLHEQYVLGQPCDHGTEAMTICPTHLDEEFGYWLGVLVGDGSMSEKSRHVAIVNSDHELLFNWQRIGEKLFGMSAGHRIEPTKVRVFFYSLTLIQWLHNHLDIKIGYAAPIKEVPSAILRSPRSVVASFLRGLFDADGCAPRTRGGQVVYISRSEKLAKTVQHLLLKFGVICRIRLQNDLCYRLTITGQDAAIFAREIGFGLSRKQDILEAKIAESKWRRKRKITTKIVGKTEDYGVTFDFSVDETHRYTAGAFLHHNCATYTHYRIMNRLHEKGLMTDGAMMEFLHSHTNVVFQPHFYDKRYSGINPYALGFAMMCDIERICHNPTEEDLRWFPDWAGCGKEMEVLKEGWAEYRDESFIRQFLSPKVIRDLKLFQIKDDRKESEYVVTAIHNDAGYRQIVETLANSHERHAHVPQIEVVEMDPKERSLKLVYRPYQKRALANADKMMKHVQTLWGNPKVSLFDEAGRALTS
jgi:spore cortex formation protein SpoVR/YcgB (stage V sporulation)